MYTILVFLLLVLEVHVGVRLTSIYRRSLCSSTVARPPQTGDLILFLGNPFLSYVLNSPFTHVGIVVALAKGPVVLHLPPEQNQPCVCDLNLLKGEHVAYRSIKIGLSTAKMRKLMRQAFAYDFESWKTVFHHTFGDSLFFPWVPKAANDTGKLCCSAYVAWLLEHFSIDMGTRLPMPEDFSSSNSKTLGRWEVEKKF